MGWASSSSLRSSKPTQVPADESLVFDDGLDDKWERAIGKIGIDFSKLSGDAGHA
jgi:putative transcriptional regulator